MNVLEKEIEDLIWDSLHDDPKVLKSRGFEFNEKHTFYRQVHLGDYGIADLIGVHLNETYHFADITIYELKKEKVTIDTLLQAARYAKGISRMNDTGSKYTIQMNFCLVGKSVELGNNFVYLFDYIDNLTALTYSIDLIQGVKFKEVGGYKLSKEVQLGQQFYNIPF
jgi:hypothetical protein